MLQSTTVDYCDANLSIHEFPRSDRGGMTLVITFCIQVPVLPGAGIGFLALVVIRARIAHSRPLITDPRSPLKDATRRFLDVAAGNDRPPPTQLAPPRHRARAPEGHRGPELPS
jgi:hypothetical protein